MDKIFDESFVDCNDCGAYWNDQCDGLPLDRAKHCNAYYKATRNIDIPTKIKSLENQINALKVAILLEIGVFVLFALEVVNYV